jgi:hypothetical protein
MKIRLIWFAIGLAVMLVAQDAVNEWTERFASWTAIRSLDSPARNAVHLRQTATITNARA